MYKNHFFPNKLWYIIKIICFSLTSTAFITSTTKITTIGIIPNHDFTTADVGKIISPQMGKLHQNQPIVFDGYAFLTGNAVHQIWDISDPYAPQFKKELTSQYADGEAESHQVSLNRDETGNYYMATISGKGFDIWDVTNSTNPGYVVAFTIPGINYGDVDRGIWGLSWQGDFIYVGATNNGVIVVDVSDVTAPKIVNQVTMTQMGGVKAGPLFAMGSLLIVTSPKGNSGVATLDISNPAAPNVLDFEKPYDNSSYIGGFYGKNAVIINPLRIFDVTTDPANIKLLASKGTVASEYVSFDSGKLFLGGVRGGSPGIHIYDLSNLNNINRIQWVPGRDSRWDDQFSCPIGNMVIMSDDQKVDDKYVGSVLAVHSAKKDTVGPTIIYTNPAPNATDVSPLTSIGISLSDWIEFKSVNHSSFMVRPVGGSPITGKWGWVYTTLTFSPDAPLTENTEYEVILTSGITDLVGNPIKDEFSYKFRTGIKNNSTFESPLISGTAPALKGSHITWNIDNPSDDIIYEWSVNGDTIGTGTSISPVFTDIGRYQGCVKLYGKKDLPGKRTFEAEAGQSYGGVEIEKENAGYTGNGYLDFPATMGNNVYAEWQVPNSDFAKGSLSFRYANGDNTDRKLNLLVNGINVQTLTFPPTGSWSSYNSITFDDIHFIDGVNKFRVVANAGTEGANLDHFIVDVKTILIEEAIEAEQATANGGVQFASNQGGYFGSGFMDFPTVKGPDVFLEWNISNAMNANTTLNIRYSNGSTANRPLNLRVNNGTPILIQFEPSGAWNTWKVYTIENLNLHQGSNTIRLTADAGSAGPNVDQISLSTIDDNTDKLLESKCFVQVLYENTTAKPISSQAMIMDGNTVWNVNPDANTVTVINATSHTKIREVAVGKSPQSIASVGPNLWVVNRDSWNISIINKSDGSFVNTITLPYASQPNNILVSHNEQYAYVTLGAVGKVAKISTSTRTIVKEISVGDEVNENAPQLGGMALDADGKKLLVNRFISKDTHGEVYVIDPLTMSETGTIDLLSSTTPDGSNSSRGIPNYLKSITINPNGREAWVASKKDNIERGKYRDGNVLDHETTVRAVTSRIQLSSMTDVLDQRIDIDNSDRCNTVTFSSYGDLAFITLPGNHKVAVTDTKTGAKITEITTGLVPDAAVLDATTGKLFVHNFLSRSVSIFDVKNIMDGSGNEKSITEVKVVATEPLSAQVLKGKQLFYDASSKKISQSGYMSCASCHLDGSHDGRIWDFTSLKEGFRNTIDLRGRAGTGHGRLHWTANFDEVHDFENQLRGLNAGTGLMTNADYTNTEDPFGTAKAGRSIDLDALSAYVTSLDKVPASPYRTSDGSLTEDAIIGKNLFAINNCQSCHSGNTFTDSPQELLHNIGTIKSSSGKRMGQSLTGFDTPTLKGIWNTAPYLHDGSAKTIKEAILAHTSITVTGDINKLVEYLRQIDENETNIILANSAISNINSISVYPNPAVDNIQIDGLSKGDEIIIYNRLGVAVLTIKASNERLVLPVNNFVPGVYTISITGKSTMSFVKK